jgi:hypothetical protein
VQTLVVAVAVVVPCGEPHAHSFSIVRKDRTDVPIINMEQALCTAFKLDTPTDGLKARQPSAATFFGKKTSFGFSYDIENCLNYQTVQIDSTSEGKLYMKY